MNISEYIEDMQEIESALLDFFEDEENDEINFFNLENLIKDKNIHEETNKFKPFLYLIVNVANNFHRTSDLFNRVDRILKYFENDIKNNFSNSEIFHIFVSNKRILLFLFEEKIMIFDKNVIQEIISGKYLKLKYPTYFAPEIKPFLKENFFSKYDKNKPKENFWVEELNRELPENFYSLRKNGENDSYICEMIRKDSIDDFIEYVNKNSYPITSTIKPSIYETNSYLLTNENTTLIEYSLFFGSIQIFNYLRQNGVKLTPTLWIYAIHGKNPEIIHILEENKFEAEYKSHKKYIKEINKLHKECLIESIKCHHNDITKYIQAELQIADKEPKYIIKYFNFILMTDEIINESTFYYLCKYDHYSLVNNLLKIIDFNINKPLVFKSFFNPIYKYSTLIKSKNEYFNQISNHIIE